MSNDAVIEKVAQAMFNQDHDEGWDPGEPLTKQIYLANAEVGLAALESGDSLGEARYVVAQSARMSALVGQCLRTPLPSNSLFLHLHNHLDRVRSRFA